MLDYEAPDAKNPEQEEIGGGIGGEPGPGSQNPQGENPGPGEGIVPLEGEPLGSGGGGGCSNNVNTDESGAPIGIDEENSGLQQHPVNPNCMAPLE